MNQARARWTTVSLRIGIVTLLASSFAVVASLAEYWGANPGYSDRALILLAAGWLVWRHHGDLSPAPGTSIGFFALIGGCLLAPPAWYLIGQLGPRTVLLWAITFAWFLMTAGAILAFGGWCWLRVLAFPLVFVFFALPIPERIETPLQHRLQSLTTFVAEAGLRASGMQVRREGFELHLPSGGLEVVEACSGVRSITALLAISVFVAHMRGFGLVRGMFMLILALPVIAAVNAFRIILTGWIQEYFGPEMIRGAPHERLGVSMVVLGLGLVLLISQLLAPRRNEASQLVQPRPRCSGGNASLTRITAAVILLLFGVGMAGNAYRVGRARVVEQIQNAPLNQLPLQVGEWTGEDLSIPDETREMLTFDRALFRRYRDEFGHEIYVWVIYWRASASIRGYHHPDVCFPNRGWTATRKDKKLLAMGDDREVECTIRHFERDRSRLRLYYWTQEGRTVLSDDEEFKSDYGLERMRHFLDEQAAGQPLILSSRLSVLIQSDLGTRGDRGERMVDDFTKQFVEGLYEICPWARPDARSSSPSQR